ncbi:hypothetical protein [Sphingobium yanoikuyae]|uniref:hypothetical protein n=1 Tax=Sphingobium yanoikuyae TaxID=13690 RepID=UPI00242E94FD|nr:hypothetical protein [Sphingobium yanoikuyae]
MSTLLLGFAATAIAFAFHETSEWKPSIALYVVAAAVAAWAASFIFGILWAHDAQRAMLLNAAEIEITDKQIVRDKVTPKLESTQRRTARHYMCQLSMLGVGAGLYAVGFAFYVHGKI